MSHFGYSVPLFREPEIVQYYSHRFVAKRLKYYRTVKPVKTAKSAPVIGGLIGSYIGNTSTPQYSAPPASEFTDANRKTAPYLNAAVAGLVMRTFPWDPKVKVRDNITRNTQELMSGLQAFQSWYKAAFKPDDNSLRKWNSVLDHLRANPFQYSVPNFKWEQYAEIEKVIINAYKPR